MLTTRPLALSFSRHHFSPPWFFKSCGITDIECCYSNVNKEGNQDTILVIVQSYKIIHHHHHHHHHHVLPKGRSFTAHAGT